jgi:sugar-specific transcriptional regulator TrmB
MNDTIFDHDADSRLNIYDVQVKNLFNLLERFNLTHNEAKVYLFLGKYGTQTAIVISRTMKIPRTETYDLLMRLQRKGIVQTIIGHPTRYDAVPFRDATKTLLDSDQQRINALKRDIEESAKSWDEIPNFAIDNPTKEARLQNLQGKHVVVGRIDEMCKKAKELLVLGSEKDFVMFYHSGILDRLTRPDLKIRVLTSCSDKTMHMFSTLDKSKIKQIPQKSIETFGFIVKDDDEAIFFIKNEENDAQEQLALSTDSIGMINNLKMSFDLIWSTQNTLGDKAEAKNSNQDYEFKLKEMQQQNLILQEINDYLQKAGDKTDKKPLTAKSVSKKSKNQ